jgi:excisionase family DNA binding protein
MDQDLAVLAKAVAERVAALLKDEFARPQAALLTVKQAGIYLGRSKQSVQHLIFQRELPVVRAGRRVHLDRHDLDAWIAKNKDR